MGFFEGDCSPYRCFDMAGNVLEWTSDWYDRYYLGTLQNPDFGKKYKVLRGGSWQSMSKGYLRSSKRSRALPDSRGQYGFRCVIDMKDLPSYKSRVKESTGPRTQGSTEDDFLKHRCLSLDCPPPLCGRRV